MTKKIVAAGMLVTAGIIALFGCSKSEPEKSMQAGLPVVTTGRIQQVVEEPVSDFFEATGTVRARNYAVISSRLPGSIASVMVKEGERVSKGKLLATIDAGESTAGAAAAAATVEEAARGVDEAASHKKLAEVTFERYQKLFAEQAVSRQEFDNRQAEKDVAVQGLARAQARLVQAKESAKAAGLVSGYTRITAPLAGVISGKQVETGMTVFPGTPLLTVEEEGAYRLEIAVPETLVGKLKLGMPLGMSVDGLTGELTGRVVEVNPGVDTATRTFIAKIDIAAKNLKSGSYGKARIPVGTTQGIMIPKTAVIERGALTSVWVVGPDKIVRMRLIRIGKSVGERVEVLSGLSNGERIITGDIEKMADGVKVE